MASDNLHPILKDIQGKIVNVRDDLQNVIGELRKVRETIREGIDSILEAINDNIQAQAELKMMERVANVRSIPAQISAEEEQIGAEKDELEAKLESIGERYQRRHEELDQQAEQRVRNLGEHIFEIQEDEFENNIEQPFHEHVTETWREMQLANSEIGANRIESLESELDETHTTIDDLLEQREQFLTDLHRNRVSTGSFSSPQQIQVPFWIVTVERNGERMQEIVGPADLEQRSDAWYTAELAERPGFRQVIEDVAHSTTPQTTETVQLQDTHIQDSAAQYIQNDIFGQTDFADKVGETMGDTVPVTVEGSGGDVRE